MGGFETCPYIEAAVEAGFKPALFLSDKAVTRFTGSEPDDQKFF